MGRLGPFKQLVDFSCRFGEWSTWPKPRLLPQTFRISHASTEVKLRLTELQLNQIREYSRCVTACCQMIELWILRCASGGVRESASADGMKSVIPASFSSTMDIPHRVEVLGLMHLVLFLCTATLKCGMWVQYPIANNASPVSLPIIYIKIITTVLRGGCTQNVSHMFQAVFEGGLEHVSLHFEGILKTLPFWYGPPCTWQNPCIMVTWWLNISLLENNNNNSNNLMGYGLNLKFNHITS